MDKSFESIGAKLDSISQKIDKLTLSIKALTIEFSKINENLVDNLSKISKQIVAFNENINDSSSKEFERSTKLLNEIYANINKFSDLPTSKISDISLKLESIFNTIEQIVNPETLNAELVKIKNFISKIE